MKNILINGVSAKSGGGKSILTNFLKSVYEKQTGFKFIVVVPINHGYEKYNNENVKILTYDDRKLALLKQLYFYFMYVKKIIKIHKIELIFNLSDVIIPYKAKQLLLFDWPYAVYPESNVWEKMSGFEYYYRKFKLLLFKKYISYPDCIYAQTVSVKQRLQKLYSLHNIGILPNAVSVDNFDGGTYKDFSLPSDRVKFVCLSKYYVHKNIEVFIPLARLIKQKNLPYSIVITIDASQHKNAGAMLNIIKEENLQDIIINVGEVEMKHVPSLYKQSDALLLPTLLESFSGTYVEAMYHKKPIFTSDMDFAKDVCQDAAIYFDPSDPQSLLNAIEKFSDKDTIEKIVEVGKNRINNFLTWEDVSLKILTEIKNNI